MVLVDTSVWSDHLRRHNPVLAKLLMAGQVLAHPFVTGELACAVSPRREETLALLQQLPSAPLLGHAEVLGFIDRHSLAGIGIGFVDVHLLASALVAGVTMWTRDRRLTAAATRFGIGAQTKE